MSPFQIQSDYKWCEWLHKFIGKKVTAMQKLNVHHCKEQLRKFLIPYANSIYAPSVALHT
jgi:hypothetical protein